MGLFKGYQIRYVKERVSLARFHLYKCHEVDHTFVFDCTAVPPAIVEAYIRRFMILHQLTLNYTLQRSSLRPGYVYVHFKMKDGKYA